MNITMDKVQINSEIGKLNAVLLHKPGCEIEQMTPENAGKALYSDILNLNIVDNEYDAFSAVLKKWAKTYYVEDLLEMALEKPEVKQKLVEMSCIYDDAIFLKDELLTHSPKQLAKELIEGFRYRKGIDPDKFAEGRFILKPLYNLFYTRDASSSVYNQVLIHSMSNKVRERETLIFDTVFTEVLGVQTFSPLSHSQDARTEGGDVLIAREDTLFVGNGSRTNKEGIKFLEEKFRKERGKFNILYQELPQMPESFIHLDMVFTFLDKHKCMMYQPLIKKTAHYGQYQTVHIEIDNGKVRYHEKPNFLQGVSDLGFDLEPISCGGDDYWVQQREQWHSGANFFALGEGKIIGYARNTRSIEALDAAGFSVLDANDVKNNHVDLHSYNKFVVAFAGSELPRGGGGARCMTMPFNRDEVKW